jgi:hypothetical protein
MPSSRLWFRLDEVRPIAEHAMACPSHHLTREQVAAGARLRPALTWTPTDDGVALSSNGVPLWYDDDGQVHAAHAWTWHHPASGRRGSDAAINDTAVNDADRYLPLLRRYRDRRLPLITRLRKGAEHGGHWFVVDTDPARDASRDRYQVLDHRDDLMPPNAPWVRMTVTAGAVWHGQYPALVADGYTVRGDDVIARFERPVVEQMAADLALVHACGDSMPGEVAALRFDGDVLSVEFGHDDGHEERWIEVDRVHPDRQGYYAVGAYLWPWTP